MTTAASALYREQVLDHGHAPRGVGCLPEPARCATAHNALCGDRVRLSLQREGDGIVALRHQSEGCLLCLASASLMAEHLPGMSVADAAAWSSRLRRHLQAEDADALGPFAALAGVAPHPGRHRCVLLPWEALEQLLHQAADAP